MSLEGSLDSWHRRAIHNVWLQLFTAIVRVLLAIAFIPAGLTKMTGHRFTMLPISTPVGYYFDALYNTQGYYRFIGTAQVIAGLLLLFRSTATLGAVLYFPIIINIVVITAAIPDFGNTRFISAAMSVACFYLLCWEWDRWKRLLPFEQSHHAGMGLMIPLMTSMGLGFMGILGAHLARLRHSSPIISIALILVGTVIGLMLIVRHYRNFDSA